MRTKHLNMKSMNGHVIFGTSICVDFWPRIPLKNHYHFLTHLHADHTYNLTSSFSECIYTSPFNAWLVKRWFNIKPELINALTVGDTHVIHDEKNEKFFSVTLLNANHCPGSVMFLFQGSFGNILYTGDFRYNPDVLEHPMLKSVIESEVLNKLYLDNTFAAEHCEFPPRQEVLKDVLNLVRNHPDHHIIIGIRKLGKEEVIRTIALELQEKVWVPKERLTVLTYLQYEDVFTTNLSESRIFVKEIHQLNSNYVHRLQEEKGPVLTILLTALYSVMPVGSRIVSKLKELGGVHYFPYSDHSCHSELVKFVSTLKPETIYPIIGRNQNDIACSNPDQSEQFDFLSLSSTWNNSVIPESILKFAKDSLLHPEDKFTLGVNSACEVQTLQNDTLRDFNQDTVVSQITEEKSNEYSQLLPSRTKSDQFQNHMKDLSSGENKTNQSYLNTNFKQSSLNSCLADPTTYLDEEEYILLSDEDLIQPDEAIDNNSNSVINNYSPQTNKGTENRQDILEVDNESPHTSELTDNSQNIEVDSESPHRSEPINNSQFIEVDSESPHSSQVTVNSQNKVIENDSPQAISDVTESSQNTELSTINSGVNIINKMKNDASIKNCENSLPSGPKCKIRFAYSTPVAKRQHKKLKKYFFATPFPTTLKKSTNKLIKNKRCTVAKESCETKDINISVLSDIGEYVEVTINESAEESHSVFTVKENDEHDEVANEYECNQKSSCQFPQGAFFSEKQKRTRQEKNRKEEVTVSASFYNDTTLKCTSLMDKPVKKCDSKLSCNFYKKPAKFKSSALININFPKKTVDEQISEVNVKFVEFCNHIIENRAYKRWREMSSVFEDPQPKKSYDTAANNKLANAYAKRFSCFRTDKHNK